MRFLSAIQQAAATPLVLLLALLLPDEAAAHLVTTGMGPVYDGSLHLLLTPEDLLPVLALAAYAGLRGARYGRQVLFVLPLSWFIGGMAGMYIQATTSLPLAALSFLLVGLLVAADLNLPLFLFTPIALFLAVMHGVMNGLALRDGPGSLGLLGISCTIFVLVALLSASVLSLTTSWQKIAIRVMGSWVAAAGLLMLGWFARGQ